MRIRLSEYQSDVLLRRKPGLDIERLLSIELLEGRSIRVVFKDRIFGWRLAIIPEGDRGQKPTILFGRDAERVHEEITALLESNLDDEELEAQFWGLIGQLHGLPLPKEFEATDKS